MAKKLGEFQTPTGAKGNILNPGDWLSLLIGAVVLFLTVAMGQRMAAGIGGKFPVVDGNIEPFHDIKPEKAAGPSRTIL